MLFIKLSAKLKFCEKEPTDAEKIEKTLSTMLPAQMILQQQYCERGFTIYFELIKTLLQAKRHNELLLWNSNLRPVGTKPLPEVHANTQNKQQRNATNSSNPGNFKGKNKCRRQRHRKSCGANKTKDVSKLDNKKPNKSSTCHKCGCYSHLTQKCRTPKHLVELYLNSVGRGRFNQGRSNQGGQFEAHFNSQLDVNMEQAFQLDIPMQDALGCSYTTPMGTSNTKALPPPDGNTADQENMIVEFATGNIFGYFN